MHHLFKGLARLTRVNCCRRGAFRTMASTKDDFKKQNNSCRSATVAEISIDVPWGQISGKAWGSPTGKPVLSLHGWLDNAGSFDKLIPLLSPDLYVVALDLPGHGFSSPRPAGIFYHLINYVTDLKYVIDGLGWKKFSFLSHSMGAGVATIFAASLPEYVEKMIALEGIVPHPLSNTSELPTRMGNTLKNSGKFEGKAVRVYPSQEACVARLMEANKNLTQESAEILTVRGTAPVENGYVFTRDLRLKLTYLLYFNPETILSFVKAVQCPVLLISAEQSVFPKEELDQVIRCLKMNEIITLRAEDIIEFPCNWSKWVVVPGNHHVHLNNAASVAPFVNEWLTTDEGLKNML